LRAVGAFVEEITDFKRTLEQLQRVQEAQRRRAEELQTLMEAAPAAIWIADDPACTRITGNPESYSLVEMTNGNVSATAPDGVRSERNFQEFQDGKPAAPHELPMQRAAATGKPVRGADVTLVFNDGHVRHIYGNASPLRDAAGAVRGAVSVFIDVTERKQAEEALRAADQRKNEFIATLLTSCAIR
jgi:PAS domain-containing protein